MNERPLEEALREHYAGASLRPEALARLRVMARTHPKARLPSRRALWITVTGGVLAIVVLLVGMLLPYLGPPRLGDAPKDLAPALLSAVRDEHRAAREPAIRTDSYEELRHMTASLGFSPSPPRRLAGKGYLLVGASRLTLFDAPAVELVLSGPEGERVTLIQMRGTDIHVSDGRALASGTYANLWHEGELLYAMAR